MPGTPFLLPKPPGLFDSLTETPQFLPNNLRPVRPADWSGEWTYFQTSCASCVCQVRFFFTAEFSSPWALDSPNPELPGPSYCLMRSTVSHVYGVSNLGS